MVRRWLHLDVRIRSSPSYLRSGGASSISRGCVESCAQRISRDPIDFRVCWCGFRSVSFDLRLSSLATVATLVRWSFWFIARGIPVCLLQQALLLQPLLDFSDEGARTAARLWLALVFVVVARCSKNLLVYFIIFGFVRTDIDDY
jgi:hypothetical protein